MYFCIYWIKKCFNRHWWTVQTWRYEMLWKPRPKTSYFFSISLSV